MRKLIMSAAVLALASPAFAADLAVKSPAAKSFAQYPYNGSGCYWGINAEAGAANSDVSGNALFVTGLTRGNLVASGASVGGSIGCMRGDGTNWIAVQGNFNYQNVTGSLQGPIPGDVGVQSRWQASQVIKLGGFPALLSWLPNLGLTFPVIAAPAVAPAGLNVITATSHPYVGVGIQEFDNSAWIQSTSAHNIAVAPLLTAGIINQLTDSTGKWNGAVLDTYAKVVFAGRGFTINNVGSDPTLSGAANLGTQYFAGVAIYY